MPEVLYTQFLRYNIYSPWFLDIRISTCLINFFQTMFNCFSLQTFVSIILLVLYTTYGYLSSIKTCGCECNLHFGITYSISRCIYVIKDVTTPSKSSM